MKALVTSIVIVIALGLAACGGGTSSLDVCHAGCDSQARCGMVAQPQVRECNQTCDSNSPQFEQADVAQNGSCKNAVDVRSKEVACYHGDCMQQQACLQSAQIGCVGTH